MATQTSKRMYEILSQLEQLMKTEPFTYAELTGLGIFLDAAATTTRCLLEKVEKDHPLEKPLDGQALKIIQTNLRLATLYKDDSGVAMVKHQEELIKEFCGLGFTRNDFFARSRKFISAGA